MGDPSCRLPVRRLFFACLGILLPVGAPATGDGPALHAELALPYFSSLDTPTHAGHANPYLSLHGRGPVSAPLGLDLGALRSSRAIRLTARDARHEASLYGFAGSGPQGEGGQRPGSGFGLRLQRFFSGDGFDLALGYDYISSLASVASVAPLAGRRRLAGHGLSLHLETDGLTLVVEHLALLDPLPAAGTFATHPAATQVEWTLPLPAGQRLIAHDATAARTVLRSGYEGPRHEAREAHMHQAAPRRRLIRRQHSFNARTRRIHRSRHNAHHRMWSGRRSTNVRSRTITRHRSRTRIHSGRP